MGGFSRELSAGKTMYFRTRAHTHTHTCTHMFNKHEVRLKLAAAKICICQQLPTTPLSPSPSALAQPALTASWIP